MRLEAGSLHGSARGGGHLVIAAIVLSSAIFSAEGFGYGPARLFAGLEGLSGLLMIGWTSAFTYWCIRSSGGAGAAPQSQGGVRSSPIKASSERRGLTMAYSPPRTRTSGTSARVLYVPAWTAP